jgi:predicted nuclease of predicted toxin-antitoxin system
VAFLYSDENFPLPVVERLRDLGHDVLTAREAGNANLQIPDEDVLSFAIANGRAVITRNRRDFMRLHQRSSEHAGIVVCTEDSDFEGVAMRIHQSISSKKSLNFLDRCISRCCLYSTIWKFDHRSRNFARILSF